MAKLEEPRPAESVKTEEEVEFGGRVARGGLRSGRGLAGGGRRWGWVGSGNKLRGRGEDRRGGLEEESQGVKRVLKCG